MLLSGVKYAHHNGFKFVHRYESTLVTYYITCNYLCSYDHTNDYDIIQVIKYADDTALLGLLNDNNETLYIQSVNKFAEQCKKDDLKLNATKTREMVIDFQRSHRDHQRIMIDGETVERIDDYK